MEKIKACKENNYLYNKNLTFLARELRANMTKAEACLWKYVLKSRKMLGYQFNRQRPVLNYIADFMCKDLKLIIEVDGITHNWEKTYRKDLIKQRDLESAGFTVHRFTDGEILNDIGSVIYRIEQFINISGDIYIPPS